MVDNHSNDGSSGEQYDSKTAVTDCRNEPTENNDSYWYLNNSEREALREKGITEGEIEWLERARVSMSKWRNPNGFLPADNPEGKETTFVSGRTILSRKRLNSNEE
ncbi:hypothetical protein [Natrarchaeobius oligotrophus]|uniref:hypothetical protein n=1 Tax=Natrarchaeobius oligotrophus TaxID=3455743 RepID=UPI000F526377|nr:hypothetical protein [Natrarchaeobius chitinivorans]